jgi:GNAT superfamily N-acetyltransferase
VQLPDHVADACEAAEAEAWADVALGVTASEGDRLTADVRRIGTACVAVAAGIDSHLINRVIGLGVARPATEADIDDVLALYREHGLSSFAVSLAPKAAPGALAHWLAERGLGRSSTDAKLWRPVGGAPRLRTDLRIELVGADRVADFACINCAAWRTPTEFLPWFEASVGRECWYHYLAFDGADPVAAGALFVTKGVGWLGFGATLPNYRKRGAHGALLARRIRDAAQLGCEIVVTETRAVTTKGPSPSYRNMVRAGFELAYRRPNYAPAEAKAQS